MAVPGGSGSQRAGWWGRLPELAASARSPLILCGSGRREESKKTRLWGLLQAVPAPRMAMLEEGLALKHTQPALPCRGVLGDPARRARPHACPLFPRHVVPTGAKSHTSWHAGAVVLCGFHLKSQKNVLFAHFISNLRGKHTAEGSRKGSAAQQSLPSS